MARVAGVWQRKAGKGGREAIKVGADFHEDKQSSLAFSRGGLAQESYTTYKNKTRTRAYKMSKNESVLIWKVIEIAF